LTGKIELKPGRRPPNIGNTRPPGLERLFRGKAANLLPDMLAMVFSICGHAHRLTARRAIDAARGRLTPLAAADADQLRWHTAREQTRRIAWDWPALMAPKLEARQAPPQPLFPPLNDTGPSLSALTAWVERDIFGQSAERWSEAFQSDGTRWLQQWADGGATTTARLLRSCGDAARTLTLDGRPLRLQRDDAAQLRLARLLSEREADLFVRSPTTAEGVAETGAWTRHLDPLCGGYSNVWMRLGARLLDLAKLCHADYGASWLCCGGAKTGPNEGLAWTETARGLLIHWVRLDHDQVEDCRVLAPTDWNFHPSGLVAQALSALPADERGRHPTDLLLSVFDPCAPYDVDLQPEPALA